MSCRKVAPALTPAIIPLPQSLERGPWQGYRPFGETAANTFAPSTADGASLFPREQ